MLAEHEPWFELEEKASTADKGPASAGGAAEATEARRYVLGELTNTVRQVAVFGSPQVYPLLTGTQPDLYRAFMSQMWDHMSAQRDSRDGAPGHAFHRGQGRRASRAGVPNGCGSTGTSSTRASASFRSRWATRPLRGAHLRATRGDRIRPSLLAGLRDALRNSPTARRFRRRSRGSVPERRVRRAASPEAGRAGDTRQL